MSERALRALARRITLDADVEGAKKSGTVPCSELRVGQYYMLKGQLVKMVDGAYMGDHGVSNFWHWRPVLKTGLLGEEVWGYGGGFKEVPADMIITETVSVTKKPRRKKKAKKK